MDRCAGGTQWPTPVRDATASFGKGQAVDLTTKQFWQYQTSLRVEQFKAHGRNLQLLGFLRAGDRLSALQSLQGGGRDNTQDGDANTLCRTDRQRLARTDERVMG